MGVLRLLLAIAVVLYHLRVPQQLTGGPVAVESFFIISGFYMALILDGRYAHAWTFYTNRALRLFPTYWAIAAVSFVYMCIFASDRFASFAALPTDAKWLLGVTNLTIAGQDAVWFLGSDGRGLFVVRAFQDVSYETGPQLWHYLLVLQAWSLSVEIAFYAMAPVLLRQRTAVIAAVALLSVGLRCYAYGKGFDEDPWSYRFFPFELSLFLAGSCAYRLYRRCKARIEGWTAVVLAIPLVATLYLLVTYSQLPDLVIGKFSVRTMAFYGVLCLSLPFIFALTKDIGWDRWIGELSYPLYLCHMLVISVVRSLGDLPLALHAVVSIVLSLVVSTALVIWIDRPLARIRERRLSRRMTRSPPPAPELGGGWSRQIVSPGSGQSPSAIRDGMGPHRRMLQG
jgi:peptidoglycan/LPS O-acetylase OafA/YrhL